MAATKSQLGALAAGAVLIFMAGLFAGRLFQRPKPVVAAPSPALEKKNAATAPVTPAAAPGPTPAKTEETKPPAKPRDDAPYSMQLGSFSDEKAAKQLLADLKERGYSPVIFKAIDSDQRIWYAVRIGGFEDVDSASKAAAAFTSKEQIQALVRKTGAL